VVNGELLVRMVAEQRVPAVAITDAMREKIIGRPGSEVLLEMLTSKWKVHWAEDHFGQLQTRLSIWVPREGGR